MSTENVKKFYAALAGDEELRNQFRDLEGGQPGVVFNQDDAKKFFADAIQPLAERLGYSFTYEEVAEFEQSIRQNQDMEELTDSELEAVCGGGDEPGTGGRGGYGWCAVLGFGDFGAGPSVDFGVCFFYGSIASAKVIK